MLDLPGIPTFPERGIVAVQADHGILLQSPPSNPPTFAPLPEPTSGYIHIEGEDSVYISSRKGRITFNSGEVDESGEYFIDNLPPPIGGATANFQLVQVLPPPVAGQQRWQMRHTGSSRRYKDDIKPVPLETARELLNLHPQSFTWKANPDNYSIGLIAEDAAEHGPKGVAVHDLEGRPDNVDYNAATALLVGIVKDNSERIAKLEIALAAAYERLDQQAMAPPPTPQRVSSTRRQRGTRRKARWPTAVSLQ